MVINIIHILCYFFFFSKDVFCTLPIFFKLDTNCIHLIQPHHTNVCFFLNSAFFLFVCFTFLPSKRPLHQLTRENCNVRYNHKQVSLTLSIVLAVVRRTAAQSTFLKGLFQGRSVLGPLEGEGIPFMPPLEGGSKECTPLKKSLPIVAIHLKVEASRTGPLMSSA